MKTPATTLRQEPTLPDSDMLKQANPGHGIPSQDPEPAAQTLLLPEDAERETQSALVGGGVVAGAAVGAAIGVLVSGPVGIVVGTTVGALAGALGGAATGEQIQQEPTLQDPGR